MLKWRAILHEHFREDSELILPNVYLHVFSTNFSTEQNNESWCESVSSCRSALYHCGGASSWTPTRAGRVLHQPHDQVHRLRCVPWSPGLHLLLQRPLWRERFINALNVCLFLFLSSHLSLSSHILQAPKCSFRSTRELVISLVSPLFFCLLALTSYLYYIHPVKDV